MVGVVCAYGPLAMIPAALVWCVWCVCGVVWCVVCACMCVDVYVCMYVWVSVKII